ncbi:hypothetical protein PMIN01_07329 [Paraphaeosphaeria minitans]|uniref:Uncharacterized protein n=1 Tax=Paraphaeosphaeria minitans TaxID=565426 RepID=A0A9P6KQ51_9PLEO|nr:hypothetical protein PMIN01_07329 [Paraphaeosphaeria minitans]
MRFVARRSISHLTSVLTPSLESPARPSSHQVARPAQNASPPKTTYQTPTNPSNINLDPSPPPTLPIAPHKLRIPPRTVPARPPQTRRLVRHGRPVAGVQVEGAAAGVEGAISAFGLLAGVGFGGGWGVGGGGGRGGGGEAGSEGCVGVPYGCRKGEGEGWMWVWMWMWMWMWMWVTGGAVPYVG